MTDETKVPRIGGVGQFYPSELDRCPSDPVALSGRAPPRNLQDHLELG